MSDREVVAQRGPRTDLDGFPTYRLDPARRLHRAHAARNGPWWFSSSGGRFDLPVPQGTCYLATSALVALRERLGPVLAARAALPAGALDDVVVSLLRCGRPGADAALRLANLRVQAAVEHGATRELEVMVPYGVPNAWARGFAGAGLDGVRYGPRFTPGSSSSVAIFGPAGADGSRAVDPEPMPAVDVPGAPPTVRTPRRAELTVLATPRRARR